VTFTEDQIILRRYFRATHYSFIKPMRVISDDDAGLLLWMPAGSEFAVLIDADGKTPHDLTRDEMREPRLVRQTWRDNDILVLMPPGAEHSIWWFFHQGTFIGWYVNLETQHPRDADGVDITDLVLDVWIEPDRTWEWKDEDEMATRVGHPLYFDSATAAAVRAEGERVIKLAEAGAYPFDGTHVDFRPDPAWPVLTLPPGWEKSGERS
jgi:uncharacterized protein DUF402